MTRPLLPRLRVFRRGPLVAALVLDIRASLRRGWGYICIPKSRGPPPNRGIFGGGGADSTTSGAVPGAGMGRSGTMAKRTKSISGVMNSGEVSSGTAGGKSDKRYASKKGKGGPKTKGPEICVEHWGPRYRVDSGEGREVATVAEGALEPAGGGGSSVNRSPLSGTGKMQPTPPVFQQGASEYKRGSISPR